MGIIPAIAAIILFFFTEDFTLPMIWWDQWTIWHIVIAAVIVVLFIVAMIKKSFGAGTLVTLSAR